MTRAWIGSKAQRHSSKTPPQEAALIILDEADGAMTRGSVAAEDGCVCSYSRGCWGAAWVLRNRLGQPAGRRFAASGRSAT